MAPDPGLEKLLDFPAHTLDALAHSFSHGAMKYGATLSGLSAHLGNQASELLPWFRALEGKGWNSMMLGEYLSALSFARLREEAVQSGVNLVFSGPEVQGSPVIDTPTMVRSLFNEATKDVLVASYVFHSASSLLDPLAKKLDTIPNFRVRFVVDLSHERKIPDEAFPIVAGRFKSKFFTHHWPGKKKPELWHDPRVFTINNDGTKGVMHAKLVVIDDAAALITSANFTQAAHERNIEAGVMFRSQPHVCRVRSYFDGLIKTGLLVQL